MISAQSLMAVPTNDYNHLGKKCKTNLHKADDSN